MRAVSPGPGEDGELHVEVGAAVARGEPGAGAEVGRDAARRAASAVRAFPLSVAFVFASPRYDLDAVAAGVRSVTGDAPLVGASTAGEILGGGHRESVVVGVLASPYLRVRVGVGHEVSRGWARALDEALASPGLSPLFDGTPSAWAALAESGRTAFGFLVAPGNTRKAVSACDEIVEGLKRRALGRLPIFGGAAADDWRMDRNHVLVGDRAVPDALLLAVFETELQWGIGLEHGFVPAGRSARVTRAEGHEVITLDDRPALEVCAELLGASAEGLGGEHLSLATGRMLGSPDGLGTYVPNVASFATPRGGVLLTRAAPPGTVLVPLEATPSTAETAGPGAIRKARLRGGITRPAAVLAASCALRPKFLGEAAARAELRRMQEASGGAPLLGFSSFGEQAPADDGAVRHTNGVISALVIGAELSPAARVAREHRALRDEAEALRRRNELELERMVSERTAALRAVNAALEQEIAQRRSAEEAARRHERAARALGACIEAQVRATDEGRLLEEVCRIVVEVGGYRLCWVGMAEDDERAGVRPAASWGHDDGYVASVNVSWADTERGRGPVGTAIRTGRAAIARRIREDPGFEAWRAEAMRRGFQAMIALPLAVEGRVVGALAIYAGDVEALGDRREIQLLEKLAEDLSLGLAALRGRRERLGMTAKLVESDRLAAVGTLAAGVAHEINNPLAYLLGGLDYVQQELRADASPAALDEVRAVLGEMRTGGERIREIVRDLKAISRDGPGPTAPTDLRRVAEASLNMVASELKGHGARVRRELQPVRPVLASEARLGQVAVNLLLNAAHALDDVDAGRREIAVRTRMQGDRAVLEVADTGGGIPPENVRRIFEPFFTTKPVGVGTGLGLWISRNLVTALGGAIEVESAPGAGAVFRVLLPACQGAAVAPSSPAPPASASRGRVLVVDDDELVRRAVRRALEPEHDVVVEASAPGALDRLASGERFGAIVCDLMMPGMTGMELHERLVAQRPQDAARFVFITGGAFTPEARSYLARARTPCVEKPFVTTELRTLVRSVLDRAGAGRAASG